MRVTLKTIPSISYSIHILLLLSTIQAQPFQTVLVPQYALSRSSGPTDPRGYSITFFNDAFCTPHPRNSSKNMSFHGSDLLSCDSQLMFMQPQGGAKSYTVEYLRGLRLFLASDSQCEDLIEYATPWSVVLGKCERLDEEQGTMVKGLTVEF